jgi:hypothetical protein
LCSLECEYRVEIRVEGHHNAIVGTGTLNDFFVRG